MRAHSGIPFVVSTQSASEFIAAVGP
jgi:hypothetical protein